ncbi:muscarinic acetylcholine receptor M3-like [Patiria miniata]|uniref:G-protein coupled receptors family 1 profile domain-containing protein n=1 Tax=Patiria miniata TaxID=46514 RepID=A0A914AE65_PATMI|nr:muscarinic acetylcholine receptor M3-like [Patiria miniata]
MAQDIIVNDSVPSQFEIAIESPVNSDGYNVTVTTALSTVSTSCGNGLSGNNVNILQIDPDTEGYTPVVVSLSFLVALLSFGTVLSNALVIHVIRADRTLHTVSNCFAMSLATADLLVGLLVVPFYALDVHVSEQWHEHIPAHSVWVTLDFLMTSSSILNLVLLNLDRFWSITSPMKYMRQRTKRRALILIALVWGLALALTIVPAAIWPYAFKGVFVPTKTRFVCFGSSAWLMVASAVFIYFIPLTLLCAIYSRIFRAIHRRHKMDLGRSSIASNMSNRLGGSKRGSDMNQQGFISEQELQRLRNIYEKTICRERGERHLTAMVRKKKGYCPGTHLKRYESIDEEKEGVNESCENDPFSSETNEEQDTFSSSRSHHQTKVGVNNMVNKLHVHARSVDDIFKGRITKNPANALEALGVMPTIKVPRILAGIEASMDVIRERDGSWCSSKSNKSIASEDRKGTDNGSSHHSQEMAGTISPRRKNSSPTIGLMSSSPKERSPTGSNHLSIGTVPETINTNFLQVLSPDVPLDIQKRWSSPPICVDEPGSEPDDTDQTPEDAMAAEENDDDDDDVDPLPDMATAVKRKRADSGEGALARLRANSSEMIRRASPRLARKEEGGDTESLLNVQRKSSGGTGSFYRDSFQSNRLMTQRRQNTRASYSLDLITGPRSDSGYASDCGFRRPGSLGVTATKKERRASLSFPIDSATMGALTSRVRTSVSNSFSAISGRGNKALTLLKKQDKAAKQLGFILACLLACWTPYFLQVLIYAFCPKCGDVTAMTIAVFLGYTHSLCNPILFALFNPRFQRACKRTLFPCRNREETPRGCPVVPPSMI